MVSTSTPQREEEHVPEDADKFFDAHILVTREDIAWAKAWTAKFKNGNADTNAGNWVNEHKLDEPKAVAPEPPYVEEVLSDLRTGHINRRIQALAKLGHFNKSTKREASDFTVTADAITRRLLRDAENSLQQTIFTMRVSGGGDGCC